MHAEIFDVDGASETGIEEQVPAGVMIVIVYIDAVTVPFPIAAAIEVVGGNHPIRIVVEHHAPQAEIDAPRDEYCSHVSIAPVRIRPPWPVAVVAAIFVLVPSLMLPVVVVVVMVLTRCGDRQRSC